MNGAHVRAAPREIAATDQDVLLRLALWLADVATEATLAATASEERSASSPAALQLRGDTGEPPVAEAAP